ncbi:hypothetical protein [Streptomyces orinoci]|uniref:Uncharacterized protein n=1 Tax=Streptomyces orinoci TaxID=67339 RepID=A0ABV3JR09_STRON|nr:hypothetical protein [Streptomyces orinoci]
MEAELTALAVSGATALVQNMASDAWEQVKGRLARLVSRGGDTRQTEEELAASRTELMAARQSGDEETAAEIHEEWRLRLRRVLRTDPEAARELRQLLDEVAPEGPAAGSVTVNNTISGGTYQQPVFQGQNFSSLRITEPGN